MINQTSKTDSNPRLEAIGIKPPPAPPPASRPAETDRLSAPSQDVLQSALQQQPEIRPEVVERGRELSIDANYPPKEIIRQLSLMLTQSADLSEEQA
ncbi:MAG: hypothetical protein HZA31_07585 [Opitutae bacterium]|nr:hypothetical protein [Opitutae bacterium]